MSGTAAEDAVGLVCDLLVALAPFLPAAQSAGDAVGSPAYEHLGALLADVVLQPALTYRTVVRPRVERILSRWPNATTARTMRLVIRRLGAPAVLDWNGPTKPVRYRTLLAFCDAHDVQTVSDLATWAVTHEGRVALQRMPGIGLKSYDYLLRLAGHPVIPMDRHLVRWLTVAGVEKASYADGQRLLTEACRRAGLCPAATERALWMMLSR